MLEFVEFKQRLARSHTLAAAQTEQALLALRRAVPQGYSSIETALQSFRHTRNQKPLSQPAMPLVMPQLSQLRFNEDLSTRPVWLPPGRCAVSENLLSWWEQQAAEQSQGMVG